MSIISTKYLLLDAQAPDEPGQVPGRQGGQDPLGGRPEVALGLVPRPEEGGGGDGKPGLT